MYRLKNKIALFIIGFSILLTPMSANAQIEEMVEEYVTGKIKEKVIETLFPSFSKFSIGDLWDNMVDNSARNSIKQKSGEIAKFEPAQVDVINYKSHYRFVSKNGIISAEKTFAPLKNITMKDFRNELSNISDIPFHTMGGGYIRNQSLSYVSMRSGSKNIINLSAVLNPSTFQYVRDILTASQQSQLLADINSCPGLIPAFNRNNSVANYYLKLMSAQLNKNPQELLYWSCQADLHRKALPKKNKLLDLNTFEFSPQGNQIIISNNGKTLANYIPKKDCYRVVSPEFLNFMPRANHSYEYGNTLFETDALGRVTSIIFQADKKANKMSGKNPVKYKDLVEAKSKGLKDDLYSVLFKEFGLAPAMAYTLNVYNAKQLKDNLKEFKKELKQELKSNKQAAIRVNIAYSDYSNTPAKITIATTSGSAAKELLNNGKNLLAYPKGGQN